MYINSASLEFGGLAPRCGGRGEGQIHAVLSQRYAVRGKPSPTYGNPQDCLDLGDSHVSAGARPGLRGDRGSEPHLPPARTLPEKERSGPSPPPRRSRRGFTTTRLRDSPTARRAVPPRTPARGGAAPTPGHSGFVVGASPIDAPVRSVSGGRLAYRDLVVYELNIDDYTAELPGLDPPIEKVRAKIPDLVDLGVNAIEFLPWTAWADDNYGWGYTPGSFFSIEHRYTHNVLANEDTIQRSRLKRLISKLHDAGVHVIMDGVFNHAGGGFAYPQYYLNPADCPYLGTFGRGFAGLVPRPRLPQRLHAGADNYKDVCLYWMDEFGIMASGTTWPSTTTEPGTAPCGIPGPDQRRGRARVGAGRGRRPTLRAGHRVARRLGGFYSDHARGRQLLAREPRPGLFQRALELRASEPDDDLTRRQGLPHRARQGRDELSVQLRSPLVGWRHGADDQGAMEWYRMQPYAIALFLSPGTPLVSNGQAVRDASPTANWIMENDQGTSRRVVPRALHWGYPNDAIGSALRGSTGASSRCGRPIRVCAATTSTRPAGPRARGRSTPRGTASISAASC